MPRAVVLINVPHEGPGLLGELLVAQGWDLWLVEAHAGERWPDDLGPADLLVVMGGPMGVGDLADPAYPWLAPVAALLRARLAVGAPNLGVCLGAQLLAHVLGAAVVPHERHEIGWYDLETTAEGRRDAVVGTLGERAPVFQWHGRTYGLPTGAVQLARTATCEQQAFRFGETAYGFQFHLEADTKMIERWLRTPAYLQEFHSAALPHDAAGIRAVTADRMAAMQPLAETVFNGFLDLVGRPMRRILLPSHDGLD